MLSRTVDTESCPSTLLAHSSWWSLARAIVYTLALASPSLGVASALSAQSTFLRPTRTVVVSGENVVLDAIRWFTIAPNGMVIVPMPSEGSLKLFKPDGTPLGSIGRMGEGPGEFRSLTHGGWFGDTLWVSDARQGRTSFFDAQGKYIRQTRRPTATANRIIEGPSGTEVPVILLPQAWGNGGQFDALVSLEMAPAGSKFVGDVDVPDDAVAVVRVEVATGRARIVAVLDGFDPGPCSFEEQSDRGVFSAFVPFCPLPGHHFNQHGSGIAWFDQPVSDNEAGWYMIEVLDKNGAVVLKRRVEVTRARVTAQMRKMALASQDQLRARFRTPTGVTNVGDRIPTFLPAADNIFLADDRSAWVRIPGGTPALTEWHHLVPDRDKIDRWIAPKSFRPYSGNGSELFGVETTSDGVEDIVKYRFAAPR